MPVMPMRRPCTYLDILVRPLAEQLDLRDLSHGESPRVLYATRGLKRE